MDAWLMTLRIAELTRIRSMIPDGPTDDYIRTQTRDRGLSVESSMREALLSAFRRMEHKLAVSVAVQTYREERGNFYMRPRAPPPPSQPTLCGQCQGSIVIPCHWNNVDYCSAKCSHDAGDRSSCRRGCGCTGFAIKRRQLRNQRELMRAMWTVIIENELEEELETWDGMRNTSLAILDSDSEMDEGSDAEDPMVTQANEIRAVSDIVQLSRNMVELAELRRGQKRTRDSN